VAGALSLRPARAADAAALTAIRRDAILGLAARELGVERAAAWADAAPEDRAARAIAASEVWIAERSGPPIGWVEVAENRIESLYVRPEEAGAGAGSALLARAEARIRSEGHSDARLYASPNAEVFYARRGYERVEGVGANGQHPMRKTLARG
jgi:putative acetyltransferase